MSNKRGFNFGKLTEVDAIRSITNPTVLFDALPDKDVGYGYLRSVQDAVLQAWYPRREESDLVIKTNTGGGKTIVGLLMLQSSLHEGVGPALYIAPDNHLVSRAKQEALALGIDAVDDPSSSKFLAGTAICITTMQVFMNSKSRFGIAGSAERPPINVGTIVVDDAHAALTVANQAARLCIPKTHASFSQLLELFEDDLKQQSPNAYMDIRDGEYTAVLRVPFWSWTAHQDTVMTTLHPHRNDSAFEWAWPLIVDCLPICEATVSSDQIEIKPPCPPIEKFPSFTEAKRRIYMTATLADDSLLVTHFDADPESIANSLVPDSASDLGDRLVLAPQELNPQISDDEVRQLADSIANEHNVVVLVPSRRIADLWGRYANRTVSKMDDISKVVDELRNDHVGLVVIIGRYDGIDLPDGACRLLLVDNLPFAYTGSERREASALRDTEAMVSRQLQRLEQGIGRGVRSRDDRCAVLLIGPKLTQLVSRPDVANRLSPATQAQMELSRQVASGLEGVDISEIEVVIQQVIDGDSEFRKASRGALLGIKYAPGSVSDESRHLRAAYNAARSQRYEEAAEQAGRAVDVAISNSQTRLAGWIGETHASYLEHVDSVAAQRVLDRASRNNPAILTPLRGISYEKVSGTSDQAKQACAYLASTYTNGAELIVGIEALISDINWDNSRTEEAEAALAVLGQHLGFITQRPERDFKIGSDVLWVLGNHRYLVIEAKTGATSDLVWKRDINQLAGSVNWCRGEYGSQAEVVPLVVHPSRIVDKAGTPPQNCRTIDKPCLNALKGELKKLSRALAHEDAFKEPTKVETQLRIRGFSEDQVIDKFTAITSRETLTSPSRTASDS